MRAAARAVLALAQLGKAAMAGQLQRQMSSLYSDVGLKENQKGEPQMNTDEHR